MLQVLNLQNQRKTKSNKLQTNNCSTKETTAALRCALNSKKKSPKVDKETALQALKTYIPT